MMAEFARNCATASAAAATSGSTGGPDSGGGAVPAGTGPGRPGRGAAMAWAMPAEEISIPPGAPEPTEGHRGQLDVLGGLAGQPPPLLLPHRQPLLFPSAVATPSAGPLRLPVLLPR